MVHLISRCTMLFFLFYLHTVHSQENDWKICRFSSDTMTANFILDKSVAYVSVPGELFYYYPAYNSITTTNGLATKIDDSLLTFIDSVKYLKFSCREYEIDEQDELLRFANDHDFDLRSVLAGAKSGNGTSLHSLVKFGPQFYNSGGFCVEAYCGLLASTIECWEDDNLSKVIGGWSISQVDHLRQVLLDVLTRAFSYGDQLAYYHTFYPSTSRILGWN